MADVADHFCPGCGVQLTPFLRYPWYFCKDCRKKTVDHAGRTLHFGNVSMSGGLTWRIEGQEVTYTSRGVLCLINKRSVLVGEARFGGTVAQPWTGNFNRDDKIADLRRRDPDFSKFELEMPHSPGRGRSYDV